MLKVGPYPWAVKQRVMSRVGHLSNLGMAEFLLRDLSAATAQLVLGHMSEQNNHPEIVRLVADQALEKRGLDTQLTHGLPARADRSISVLECRKVWRCRCAAYEYAAMNADTR